MIVTGAGGNITICSINPLSAFWGENVPTFQFMNTEILGSRDFFNSLKRSLDNALKQFYFHSELYDIKNKV